MTLSTVVNKIQYSGNGSTVIFSFPYLFNADADLTVVLTSGAGVDTVQTITTHYTVADAGDPAGGTVTMLTAPASGETLTIYRDIDIDQETDLSNQGAYFLDDIEATLDRIIMVSQQLQEQVARCLKLGVTHADAMNYEFPPPVAGEFLRWNPAGDAVESYDVWGAGLIGTWGTDSSGHFLPTAQNIYNIGGAGNEIHHLYIGSTGVLYLGGGISNMSLAHTGQGWFTCYVGHLYIRVRNDTGDLLLQTGTSATTKWMIENAGHLVPGTADVYDIGGTANEIRNLYMGSSGRFYLGSSQNMQIFHGGTSGNIVCGSASLNIQVANAVGDINFETGAVPTTRWAFENAGHFLPGTPNTYNIGSPTAEIKNIYMGNSGEMLFGDGQNMSIFHGGANGTFFCGTGSLYIGVDAGTIIFQTSSEPAVDRWIIQNAGHFIPGSNNAYNIGGAGATVGLIYSLGTYGQAGGSGDRDVVVLSSGLFGYYGTSALRFKENIINIEDTSWLHDLRPVSFNWKKDGVKDTGLIAEEVEKINKDLVFYDDDTGEILGVHYKKLNIVLINEVQKLKSELGELKCQLQ